MATLTIRRIEDDTHRRLRIRAASNGRSIEEEAREILRNAVAAETVAAMDLFASIRARLGDDGGADLPTPVREPVRAPPERS